MTELTRRRLLSAPLFAAAGSPPNIVFVLVDDLRWDELGCTGHPFAQTPHADRLAREGALFRNAFATTPLCSPSRACFLTGQYAHKNGITDNVDRSARSHQLITWPRLLRDTGYETAYLGKWHMGNDDSPRPGFDHWISFPGQGESTDPVLNVNGKVEKSRGYVTDVLTERAVDLLGRRRSKPFCLYLAHKAIHPNVVQRNDGSVQGDINGADAFVTAARHKSLYAGKTPPRRGNYQRTPEGKPALQRTLAGVPPLSAATATGDATILNRMRMTKAIDEGLGEMMAALERAGSLDDTVVIFTSDHGYFYGEHCLGPERRLAYEETIRIPMLVRYPRRIRPGVKIDAFALSVDIAPTALELAGGRGGAGMHGRSLVPLLEGKRPRWRDSVLVEYFSDTVFPRIQKMGYQAVRTDRWKYIHYSELEGADELYDLREDPYELRNLHGDAARVSEMKARLGRLLAQTR
ncbi:MAG: sulfatase [Bryobacteraceae bacterium]|nr:sulfatase [Bryobacteraceae bacterium]